MNNQPVTRPILVSIPDEYLRLIGLVAFKWALFESALNRTVYSMLDLSEARGRTAVRTPRAKEIVELINELAFTESFGVDLTSLQGTEEIERRRNLLVHGIWYKDDGGGFLLQDLTGKWPKSHERPSFKRRVLPAAVPIRPSDISDVAEAIEILTQNVYVVRQAIQARRSTLQQKHRAPVPQADSQDQAPNEEQEPPQSPSPG